MGPSTIHWLSAVLLITFCWAEATDDNCECVRYFLCTTNYTIKEDGRDIMNVRLLSPSYHKKRVERLKASAILEERKVWCYYHLDKCCQPPKQKPRADAALPTDNNPPVVRKKCEKPKQGNVNFGVTKDQFSKLGGYPWTVAIVENTNDNAPYQCGGSLIHPQIVLTAAHCIAEVNSSNLSVLAGNWMTNDELQYPVQYQERQVQRTIIHENFNGGVALHEDVDGDTFINDFALLVLSEPLDLSSNKNVSIVYLPETNENFDGSRCVVNGWANDDLFFGSLDFKSIDLPIMSHEKCQRLLKTTRLGKYFQLHDSFVCAGGEDADKDTCATDGGFPLACPMKGDPEKYVQVGIVALGINFCREKAVPSVYANVVAARSWIDRQAAEAGFKLDEYQCIS